MNEARMRIVVGSVIRVSIMIPLVEPIGTLSCLWNRVVSSMRAVPAFSIGSTEASFRYVCVSKNGLIHTDVYHHVRGNHTQD